MKRVIRASVSAAVLASATAGCADDSGRTVTLEAWPQVGRTIDVVAEVNGERTVGTADDERWVRSVRVDGELVASLVVVDPEGELVRCSIDLGDGEPVAAVGNGEARCSVAGEVSQDRVDVESDRFGAVGRSEPEEDAAPAAADVEILEGAMFAEVPGSWSISVDPSSGRPSDAEAAEPKRDPGDELGAAGRFATDRLEVLARLSAPDSLSSVAVVRVRTGSEIDDPLVDLVEEFGDGMNPSGAGAIVAVGAARVGSFDAARYVVDVSSRRISWFLLRVGAELIAVTAVDEERDGAVDEVLDSFRPAQ